MTEPEKTSTHGDDLLAAEYVLGVLDGEERIEVQNRLRSDPDFRDAIARWQGHLGALAAPIPSIAPPPALKRRLEAALFHADVSAADRRGWLDSLVFWRVTTAAATLAAVVALGVNLTSPGPVEPRASEPLVADTSNGYFAALRNGDAAPVVLIRFDPDRGELILSGPVANDGDTPVQPELWVIPPGQAPRSLGLIADLSGELQTRLPVGETLLAQIAEGAVLAISLEPPGGSTTGAPTGPVIAVGTIQTL